MRLDDRDSRAVALGRLGHAVVGGGAAGEERHRGRED